MVVKPSAVVFINNDLTSSIQSELVKQLYIDHVLTGAEFDALLAANENYVSDIKLLQKRVMVVRSVDDLTNREQADLVLFASHGLVSVLYNKYGPPNKTLSIQRVYYGALGYYGPP